MQKEKERFFFEKEQRKRENEEYLKKWLKKEISGIRGDKDEIK